eukprot:Opistho-1_new@61353
MEQRAAVDDEPVGHRIDPADLIEIGVAGVGVADKAIAFSLGRSDEGIAIGLVHQLDSRRTLAVEGSARVGRIGKIVDQRDVAGIGGVEMRRALGGHERIGRGGDDREPCLDQHEAVGIEPAADKGGGAFKEGTDIGMGLRIRFRHDASQAGIIGPAHRKWRKCRRERDRRAGIAGDPVNGDDRLPAMAETVQFGLHPISPPLRRNWGRRPMPPPRNAPIRRSELVLEARLEGSRIADGRVLFTRWVRAAARTPGRIGTVDPVEDVEHLEVRSEFAADPRHLERLGDTQIDILVTDALLGREHAGVVIV